MLVLVLVAVVLRSVVNACAIYGSSSIKMCSKCLCYLW